MALRQVIDDNGFPAPVFALGTTQEVAIGAASAACTNAFALGTQVIRVAVTAACRIKIGASPTATAADAYLPANAVEFFRVSPDNTMKIACIQESAGGKLTVTEMT